MRKKNKLKSKLLSLICSVGALSGTSSSKTNGISLKDIYDVCHTFNTFAKSLGSVFYLKWGMENSYKAYEHNSKDRKFPQNPDLCPELFEHDAAKKYGFTTTFDDAMSLMIGRSKQKEILRNLSFKHLVRKSMNMEKNITVVLAYGPSGTGKSQLIDLWERLFIANGFGNSFSNMPHNPPGPCRIRPADLDLSYTKVSFWNQLLQNKKMSGGSDIVNSELVSYVQKNPDGGIIDIDEADKFMDKSVQEGLRAIIDEGVLRVDGIAYPLNNYIIVIKGNMSPSSVMGKDEFLTENDIQTGLTSIDISQSLTKRMELVPFEAYSAKELFSIFMSKLAKWEEKYKNMGLKINVSDETRIKLGKFLSNNQMQARVADKLFNNLTPQLYNVSKILSNSKKNKKVTLTYNLLFDEKFETLYLEKTKSNVESDYGTIVSNQPNVEKTNKTS
jgi:hypothetical protein